MRTNVHGKAGRAQSVTDVLKITSTICAHVALFLVAGIGRAEVVYSVTSGTVSEYVFSSDSSTFTSTLGQSFQNIGQSAYVDSVSFRVKRTTTTAFTAGTLQVGIYAASGSTTSYAPTGSAIVTSTNTVNASSITNSFSILTFSGFGTSQPLDASTTYIALLSWNGVTFGSSNLAVEFFTPIPSGTYATYNLAHNGVANTTQQMYGTINVTAVPEPSTLLLGGIAATCACGGCWRRRRSHSHMQPAEHHVTR